MKIDWLSILQLRPTEDNRLWIDHSFQRRLVLDIQVQAFELNDALAAQLAQQPRDRLPYGADDLRQFAVPKEKVLVVDDDAAIRYTLTEALRGWDYEPFEAATVTMAFSPQQIPPPSFWLRESGLQA